MIGTDGFGVRDRIDVRLLALDPDFEPLFAEVEEILCEALASELVSEGVRLRARAPRSPADVDRGWRTPSLTGRAPPRMRATQRGPPQRTEHTG
ncbi:hypothetical protein [Nocardia amikacinitolerans]|uniref:hypothetical protein n=1 Tax=Nocardia amikacinitolerans TaxID=756689 RepID=UPI0020A5B267|nr:hypothetical protein [Nocardia amikacinitolerans]MCP2288435.1 hypothetical protein [Nocardia amikacinitolerans]